MFKHEGNFVYLNGLKISVELFRQLEPSYSYPNDIVVMFYDGARRHFRTKHRTWTLPGIWPEGDRYLSRVSEFSELMAREQSELANASVDVSNARKRLVKAKYPMEEKPNVIELHPRDDLNKSGTEGLRSKGKRVSRARGKRGRGTVGGSSE